MPTHNKYNVNQKYFINIDSSEKAYWLGFIWADGSVYKTGREHKFKIRIKDYDHLCKLQNSISHNGKIYTIKGSGFKPNCIHYEISICDKILYESLITHGRNNEIGIPNIPKKLIHHFIRGFFDGDGSVYTYNKNSKHKDKIYTYNVINIEIICNKSMLKSLSKYLSKNNIKFRIKNSKTEYMKYLRIDTKKSEKLFYKYIYKDADIFLERKYIIFSNYYCPLDE